RSSAPFFAREHRGGLAGDFFDLPFAGATSANTCAPSGDRRWTAAQIRPIAAVRLVNFLTGFNSVKGATPAKLFQTSTRREPGHSAASFASSLALANAWALSMLVGTAAWAAMLFSESIVNVAILLFLLPRVAVVTFITPRGRNSKSKRRLCR